MACGADGVVVDPSGRPVPGARVECAGKSTTTSPDGRFQLPGVARCDARISAPGFETVARELVPGTPARVELPVAGLSERIVVSATRRETNAEESGVAATIVTAGEMELRQSPDLADLLREIPGLDVVRSGRPGSVTSLFTRGGQSTATLLLVDGVPVNDPGGELNLAGVASNSLDRIEVVRGPESALFGAEAASGVIQLFTARGDPESTVPHGSVSYDRGSFQTDHYSGNLAGGWGGRFDYALGADQFHTAGEYPNDYFRDTSGTVNLGVRLASSTELRGIFRTFDTLIGVPNEVGFGIYDLDANESTRDSLASVRLDDVRGRNFVQRISFGYHRSDDVYADSQVPPQGPYNIAALVRDVPGPPPRIYLEGVVAPSTVAPPGLQLATDTAYLFPSAPSLTLSSRKDFDYQGTLTHHGGATVFGYEYERQDADVTGSGVSRDNHGVFLHEQEAIANRLFLSGGMRLEHNSAFGTVLTPRGAASYLLTGGHGPLSSTYLRFSAGLGITDPSLLENFARNPYYAGNPALRPEKTTSYEAGLAQEWLSRRLRTEVSVFDDSFKNLIEFVSLPYPAPGTWQNVDRSRARGLEFSAEAKPRSYLALAGNYTKMWTRVIRSNAPDDLFTGVGQELLRRPGNSGTVSVALTPRRWAFETGAVFVGERQDIDYVFGVNRNRGYQTVYAAGSFRMTKNVVPFLRIENALNSRYSEVLGYPALSRNVHGGLRVEW